TAAYRRAEALGDGDRAIGHIAAVAEPGDSTAFQVEAGLPRLRIVEHGENILEILAAEVANDATQKPIGVAVAAARIAIHHRVPTSRPHFMVVVQRRRELRARSTVDVQDDRHLLGTNSWRHQQPVLQILARAVHVEDARRAYVDLL